MPTTLILGGSGKVARHLTRQLVSKGYTVHSIIRNSSQSDSLSSLGAQPIVQSIEEATVTSLASTIRESGAQTVVWAAGAGGGNPERTKTVDQEGAIKSMDATAEAGVKRFIIVSALDMRDRENKPVPDWYDENDKKLSERVWGAIGPYMRAKLVADTELRTGNAKRGLQYTIVRPGGLSEEKGKGTVAAGMVHLGTSVSREDVAAVVVACIEDEKTIGLAFDVVGGDIGVVEAVRKVGEERIDTFEGFY